jgi:hypothetical protein|tara:strand:- start:17 stop:202 length:186 start_codon:yes stop_codon:yes gene_type:complete
MTGKHLNPTKEDIIEATDRVELFYSFIVNYLIQQPVYKLNKDYAKHIDIALEGLAKAKEEI